MSCNKLLYIIPQNPYPPIDGGKIGLYYPIKYLKKYFELYVFFRADNEESASKTCNHLKTLGVSSAYYIKSIEDRNIYVLKNIVEDLPFKWVKYYSSMALEMLRQIIMEKNIKHILVSSPHMFLYAKKLKSIFPYLRIFFREHNIESELYLQYKNLTPNMLHKMVVNWQYMKALKQEIKFWEEADKVCFISDSDYETAVKIAPYLRDKFEIVYDGFEVKKYTNDTKKDPYSIVFSGSVKTLQNAFNLKWFIENVWRKFISKNRYYKLFITGNTLEDIRKYVGLDKVSLDKLNIVNVGFVDKLEDFLSTKTYFVSPTIIGSGIRLKVLQSMSVGMVTFVTEIDYKMVNVFNDMHNIVLFKNSDDFEDKILTLENSPDLRRNISANAIETIYKVLNWENYAYNMCRIITSA